MGKKETKRITKIVVDESIRGRRLELFKRVWAKKKQELPPLEFIAEQSPGIPDGQILAHYLTIETLLWTADKALHNEAIMRGFRSWVILQNDQIQKISVKGIPRNRYKGMRVKSRPYSPASTHEDSNLRVHLLPSSPKGLKQLRTRRRRIKSHFGGLANIREVAVTLSWIKYKEGVLIGMHIHISSNVGLKAIRGSEKYLYEATEKEKVGIIPHLHVLVYLIRLSLHRVPTKVYFDNDCLGPPEKWTFENPASNFAHFFDSLLKEFRQVHYLEVGKGKHIDSMRKKLHQLKLNPHTNEVLMGEMETICLRAINSGSSPDPSDEELPF